MTAHKDLFRKNKDTNKWERIGSPIKEYVFSGNPSVDTEIIVTNPRFAKSDTGQTGQTVSLYEVLDIIDAHLDKHDGNISYLAEHGGGGGGGGGTGSNYKVVITNLNIENGYYYASGTSLTINFMITGGTSSMNYQYKVSYDNNYIGGTSYKVIKNREVVSITIDDINKYSTQSPHIFNIYAIDPFGFDIDTYTLKIVEQSVILSVNSSETLYTNENSIKISVTNKIINTTTTIVTENMTEGGGQQYNYSYISKDSATKVIPLVLVGEDKPIKPSSVQTGNEINIKIFAQVAFAQGSETKTITTDPSYCKVTFVGGDLVTAVFDGISSKSEYEREGGTKTQFATGESMIFGFRLFYKDKTYAKTSIFYAVKLDNPENTEFHELYPYGKLIVGKYFDENLHSGSTSPTDNDSVLNGNRVGVGWPIPNEEMYQSTSGWTITVRGWVTSDNHGDSFAKCDFIKGETKIFGTQIPTSAQGVENTLFAQWGCDNMPSSSSENIWPSNITNYYFNKYSTSGPVNTNLNIYKTNGVVSGFIEPTSKVPYLKLQNEAYGIINLSNYSGETAYFTTKDYYGFDFSITFKSDEHPYNDRTILLWGTNDTFGKLSDGIKINLEDVYWNITSKDITRTLHTKIQQNVINTVDFSLKYDSVTGKYIAKILVNGVLNTAEEFDEYKYPLTNNIYVGCDYLKGVINHSDVSIYDIKIFGHFLNDFENFVNAKKSQVGKSSYTEIKESYEEWKIKNLFYTDSESETKPLSHLFSNGDYVSPTFDALSKNNPVLPIMYLIASNGNRFTKDMYYTVGERSTGDTKCSDFTMQYYDPDSKKTIEVKNIAVSLQGTSTMTYKSKNLEIYFEKILDESGNKKELFQPKKDWFPESQFTLKADVVDSAHANNATIGYWINNVVCATPDYMDKNPAMTYVDSHKPKDIYLNKDKAPIDTQLSHNEVKVRHTLEGFPVILLLKFDGEETSTLLGIYSFNMGRYSDYNMGFKFLKSFSRRNESGEDGGCPSVVDSYEEETVDTTEITSNKICSFEFGSAADNNDSRNQTWSQEDLSILKHIGEFKYPYSVTDIHWENLHNLFTYTANFLEKDKYEWKNNDYVKTQGTYTRTTTDPMEIANRLCIKNAIAYFVIANALGMVDSLGKNLTLRTWDGNKWYPCFYDMDTALELTNDGKESVDTMVYIDIIKNKAKYVWDEGGVKKTSYKFTDIPIDSTTGFRVPYTEEVSKEDSTLGQNILEIYPNIRPDSGSTFGSYNSGLWNILRDDFFWQNAGLIGVKKYEELWYAFRNNLGLTQDSFVSLIKNGIGKCGEMVYNSDYNEKYISSYKTKEGTVINGNINMLHGTRIETIRGWLKDRFIFLDGILYVTNGNTSLPYYNTGTMYYEGVGGKDEFIFRVSSPIILTMNTGQGSSETFRYLLKPYIDNKVIAASIGQTTSKATTINANSVIIGIGGLNTCRFQHFGENIFLPSMSDVVVSNTTTLTNEPIDFDTVFKNSGSKEAKALVRKVDVNGSKSNGKFTVDLNDYNKISYVDISNTNVSSLALPSVPLSYLNVAGSEITNLTVDSQPNLTSLNLQGCKNLNVTTISKNKSLENISLNNLENLTKGTIYQCHNVKKIECNNNNELTDITISNMNGLETIEITGCTNSGLTIIIYECPNLKTLKFDGTSVDKICIDNKVSTITSLSLKNCENFKGFATTGGTLPYYDEDTGSTTQPIFDLSNFTSLESEGLNIDGCENIVVFKVSSATGQTFNLTDKYFTKLSLLTHVIGNYTLKGKNLFNGCSKYKMLGKTGCENDFLFTLDENTHNLSSCFAGTNCDINDVKAFFNNDFLSGVTNIEGLFSNCSAIKTVSGETFNELFKNCTNVESMDGLFNGCLFATETNYTNMPFLQKGLFSGLTKLETFENVFPSSIRINADCDLFNDGTKYIIKSIVGFNPFYDLDEFNESLSRGHKICNFFINLPEIETISGSFNGLSIVYENNCEQLFKNNTKLLEIINSFNDGVFTSGTIEKLFDGSDSTHYPQVLETFVGSFGLLPNGQKHHGKDYAQYSQTDVTVKLSNTFFGNNKASLKYYGFIEDSKYFSPSYCNFSLMRLVCETIPSEIISGCTELITCGALLNGIEVLSGTSETIELPVEGMFSTNEKLKCIPYFFSGIYGNNFTYKLRGGEFANCPLTNVSNIFNDGKKSRVGMIPYALFKNKGNSITDMSSALANATSSGIKCYSDEWLNGKTEDELREIVCPSGVWNKYVGDGVNNTINEKCSGWTEYSGITEELKKNYIDPETPGEDSAFFGKYFFHKDKKKSDGGRLHTRRYFCPPDIFNYCADSTSTDITSTFSGCGFYDKNKGLEGEICGVYGTIPPYIFDKVKKVKSLNSVFSECMYILPFKWDVTPDISGITIDSSTTYYAVYQGKMYDENMLSGFTGLYYIDGLFAGNTIWGSTRLPETLFYGFPYLQTASNLFSGTEWLWIKDYTVKITGYTESSITYPTDIQKWPQIFDKAFEKNNSITNISGMFSNANEYYLSRNLFSVGEHQYITNVANFASTSVPYSGSTVIPFWDFSSYGSKKMSYGKAYYNAKDLTTQAETAGHTDFTK